MLDRLMVQQKEGVKIEQATLKKKILVRLLLGITMVEQIGKAFRGEKGKSLCDLGFKTKLDRTFPKLAVVLKFILLVMKKSIILILVLNEE